MKIHHSIPSFLRSVTSVWLLILSLAWWLGGGEQEAWAVSASPKPIWVLQPGGEQVLLRIRGDEHRHWYEDMEGYTVVRSGEEYVYAQLDAQGQLTPTMLLAGQANPAASGLGKGLQPVRPVPPAFNKGLGVSSILGGKGGVSHISATGNVKNLVILCKFSDHLDGVHTRDQGDYDILFNHNGPHALVPTGSVKDFYKENSYGTLTLDSTVVAWVTLPHTEAYYANGQHGTGSTYPQNAEGMVTDALNLVEPLVNFGDFDTDSDGFIDAITFIHSGYGAETGGGGGNWIWSHYNTMGTFWTSSDLNGNGNNVTVDQYHTEPALWGTTGSELARIGTICHELGHFFTLPDLYDTDSSSRGVGSYCLMGYSWGFDETQLHPPHLSAWAKTVLGWVTPTVITSGTYSIPTVQTNPTVYRIEQGYAQGEYLLIENRQPYGFESDLPQGGLAIWHIDENKLNNNDEGYLGQSGWPQNNKHYRVALLQADGSYDLERNVNKGDAFDVYHGGGGTAVLSPATVPNANGYANGFVQSNGVVIAGISASGPTMSFSFYGGIGSPFIYGQPESQSVELGSGVIFTVNATGSSPLSYQWKKGTNNIPGATSASYPINNAQPTDAADYSVIVSNPNGSSTSAVATLTVTAPGFVLVTLGTNAAGGIMNTNFSLNANGTNLSVLVAGNAGAFSHLLLKHGSAPTDTNYDYISQLDGQTNSINLEVPEYLTGPWYVRVKTPNNSAPHAFTLLVQTNRTDLRRVRPVTKPVAFAVNGLVTNSLWNYFRIEIPTNAVNLKIALSGAGALPDLYVQRGQLPTTSSSLKKSVGLVEDVIYLTSTDLTPGAYFIGVQSSSGNSSYALSAEIINVVEMTWDPGTNHVGSQIYSQSVGPVETNFYYKIRTLSPANGVWRTALRAVSGNSDLYLSKGAIPFPGNADFKSTNAFSDGFVLGSSLNQFNAGEDWYITVNAKTNAQFALISGSAYVLNLGDVAADEASSTNVAMGPEGYRFFQTKVPLGTLAWRLWLTNAATNVIYLKTNNLPLAASSQWSQANQTLVVSPYLNVNQLYFIGIPGTNGQIIALDSRQQTITDIPYAVGTNAFITNLSMTGFNYATFRVAVPANQIAWQMIATPTVGNPNLSVRRNFVPNENYNDAYSEVGGLVADSISLVPPGLTDGTYYLTVYKTNPLSGASFSLRTGPATVTDIDYVDTITNDETNRVGWRYYRVTDINQQLGSLGWDLVLTNFATNTQIAIRQNKAPSIRTARNAGIPNGTDYDLINQIGQDFLQHPAHQADIWYIGIYNPSNALKNFTLTTRELGATEITADNQTFNRVNQPAGKWDYFKINLDPAAFGGQAGSGSEILGWDFRLVNVTSGLPRIYIRREAFPSLSAPTPPTLGGPGSATSWPSGLQWAPNTDWTKRQFSANGTNDESGQLLAMGLGRPYEPGTYYLGIITTSTNKMSYSLKNRTIGNNRIIPITDLSYNGAAITNLNLPAREAAYYRVTLPSNQRSWKVRLTTMSGEAMLVVSTNGVPNIESEKRMQKTGNELYTLLPRPGQTVLAPGDYYLAVISEGMNATNANRIGTNGCSYRIQGLGAMPEINLGMLSTNQDIVVTNVLLDGGDSLAYHFNTAGTGIVTNWGFSISLENTSGNPVAISRGSGALADPGAGGAADNYGNEGGETDALQTSGSIINVADPFASETIMVKARTIGNGVYPNASYTLRIHQMVASPISFESTTVVSSMAPERWNYFRLDIPPDCLGWDLRLTNITAGVPQFVVARDTIPIALSTSVNANGTNWSKSAQWTPGRDWTGRDRSFDGVTNETGRILTVGMGRPLEPGTYYIGLLGAISPSSFTLLSRGMGATYTIPVPTLNFTGGVATNSLPPREAAYYRVDVPTNVPGWKMKLQSSGTNESLLLVNRGAIPSIAATTGSSAASLSSAGKVIQKANDEHFLLLPAVGQTNVAAGTYYLAVVSEGGNATNANNIGKGDSAYTLTSEGAFTFSDIGTLGPIDLERNGSVSGAETIGYKFTVPAGTLGMELRLTNRLGNPAMVLHVAPGLPFPGQGGSSLGSESYGHEGGETDGASTPASATYINFASPTPGTYYVVVKARATNNLFVNANFTLQVRDLSAPALLFDGGNINVTNQPSGVWRYYRLDIPADTNLLGIDLRLVNVLSGLPRLVMRRDVLPFSLATTPWGSPGNVASWSSSNQWAAGADWTRRQNSADNVIDENGRILAMGMGRPLQPGTYYLGVNNSSGANPMSYTLTARGIGAGFAIPVVDIPFDGGSVTNLSLAPREAAYYRVVVPSNAPSWKMKVAGIVGECLLVGLSNTIPNVEYIDPARSIALGRSMQKSGNEHYIQLPVSPFTTIAPSTNYFAVISEGGNPQPNRIGVGNASYVITSIGTAPIQDLGVVSAEDLVSVDSLGSGEVKAYQFVIPNGSGGIKIKLENRIGNPTMVLRPGTSLPDPGGTAGGATEAYGNEGGYAVTEGHPIIITLPSPAPGVYSVMVKARAASGVFSDASYRLRVAELVAPVLNFSSTQNTNGFSNVATDHSQGSNQLEDNERAFYTVHVPETLNGNPILGWKLELSQVSGNPTIRVRKDALPTDNPATGTPFAANAAYLVPPFLTNGTWYVEVRGQTPTTYTLTSNPIELERPVWVMPAIGSTNVAPGLTLPTFGDSGITTNGTLPGDPNINLAQGYSHYYAISIPNENNGLVRVALEAISGDPNLYARTNFAPTFTHNSSGSGGQISDRSMTATGTEYANWVPMNGRSETNLSSGIWYFAVRANGANVSYRLKVTTGNIASLSLTNSSVANMNILNSDWQYYRLLMPSAIPFGWQVSFNVQSGNVRMFLRDSLPPGQGNNSTDYRDWSDDSKNQGPYPSDSVPGTYAFTTPPIRPGHVYYLGFRAVAQSTFSFTINTNGAPGVEPPTIPFYGGSVQNINLPGLSQITYRIDAPADAARWKHTSLHTTNVQMYLSQGTLPSKNANDPSRSSNTNYNDNRFLLNAQPGGWPWLPNQSYYLTITNTVGASETFSFFMNGKSLLTDDDENNGVGDGMLDAWERQYFGDTSKNPTDDFDLDGVVNLSEFLEGTIPSSNLSFNPRLVTASTNGVVLRNPNQSSYVMNSIVTLTPVPNAGYVFINWTSNAFGSSNPLDLLLDGHKTVYAVFKIIGDDFATRIPINGNALLLTSTTVNGTKEPGEPNHGNNTGGHSIWWTWTAPGSGTTVIDTAGSSFYTSLGVYTGTSVSALSTVTSAPSVGIKKAKVTFSAVAGTTYQIAVDDIGAGAGTVRLALTNTVTVTNVSTLLTIPLALGNGHVQFTLQGGANQNYTIESSTNLTNWAVLQSVTTSAGGAATVTDTTATNAKVRFYRSRTP